uniref:Uncharacterized protein n=1 Tax=Tanacetum cinerariifolium TaxID=118510 RepID=A0A6L2JE71_TANCI|nr:hypothetical protein [Tanacetum cinerariifolium]
MEADDQAIQTILLGLPEDIYAAVDSCETAQEINQNGVIVVLGIANQNRNCNVVAARAEGNANRNNAVLEEIKEVNANFILMANLQQASTLGTKSDKAPVYDSGGSTENNLATEVEKVNSVNRKLRETNANLTTELSRYKKSVLKLVKKNMTNLKDTSNLQTRLERTKERFENCILKKENEYAKLWNDWYKNCEECKYDKISYDKAYHDIKQKIKRLQAQVGDLKGKSKDTPCVSNTLDPLPKKLKNGNVELEFHVRNYEKENAHLKAAYKNLFDSINVTWAQTKLIIDSLLNKLHDTIYENAKLRAQLFDKVSEKRTPPKVPQKVDKTNDLSNLVASNSIPTIIESKVVENDKVISPGMFRINLFKNSIEEKFMPNKPINASIRTNLITLPQPHVITKKVVNYDSNGFSSTGVDIATKTKRP